METNEDETTVMTKTDEQFAKFIEYCRSIGLKSMPRQQTYELILQKKIWGEQLN